MEYKGVAEGLRDLRALCADGIELSTKKRREAVMRLDDTIALLTPRVLTLEEADEADVCWIEERGAKQVQPCRISVRRDHVILRRFGTIEEIGHAVEYNVDFRCWSLRPDEDAMRITPWAGVSARGQLSRAAGE